MRESPSIVPAFAETDVDRANYETTIADLMSGGIILENVEEQTKPRLRFIDHLHEGFEPVRTIGQQA